MIWLIGHNVKGARSPAGPIILKINTEVQVIVTAEGYLVEIAYFAPV